MSIRPLALKWLSANYNDVSGAIFASKYYKPEKSWNKNSVWFFEIPLTVIETNLEEQINLICQKSPEENDFYLLEVPKSFFLKHMANLYSRKDRLSLYLSTGQNAKVYPIEVHL